MREKKFRAWDSVRKKMFSAEEMGADELQLHPNGCGFFNASSISTRLSQYYPQMIPLQYLGIRDADGKEICEGDILIWDSPSVTTKWVVEDTSGGWNPFINNCTTDKPFRYRIIGNIYENPELLK